MAGAGTGRAMAKGDRGTRRSSRGTVQASGVLVECGDALATGVPPAAPAATVPEVACGTAAEVVAPGAIEAGAAGVVVPADAETPALEPGTVRPGARRRTVGTRRVASGPARSARATRGPRVEKPYDITDDQVREHSPLVRQVVQRMLPRKPPEVSTDDLVSWGMVGLLDAIQKYDEEREASFSTYAQYRIRGSILDFLRRCDWLPRSVRQRSHDLETATVELENRLGRPPSSEEIADHLGVSAEEYAGMVNSCGAVSLVPTGDIGYGRGEEALTLDEMLSDDAESGPMSQLLRKERLEILARAIERLPEKERIAVSFYYFEGLTMREVADALDLTEGRISQLHSQAMSRMRVALSELRATGDLLD